MPTKNKLNFGTDGIRGRADQFPFTPEAIFALGIAIAKATKAKKILIGHDTRLSCEQIKKDLIAGLTTESIITMDGGVLPTPAVLQLIQSTEQGFDYGIVISASHNPYTDNGIKLFNAKSGKLSPEEEARIEESFAEIYEHPPLRGGCCNKSGAGETPCGGCAKLWPEAPQVYAANLIKIFQDKKFSLKSRIVLDCANGATYKVAPNIFEALGADVITIHSHPDGKNINKNCGSLHTENLKKTILKNNADIGFAFDGDGDRVTSINKKGEIRDGDDILDLLLQHPDFKGEKKIVGTVMTNHGLEKLLTTRNQKLIRTKVGDKYVVQAMEKENVRLGGETSGHVIIKDYLSTGDGIFVALKILESICKNDNWKMKTFKKTPQIVTNIVLQEGCGKKPIDRSPLKEIVENHEKKLIDGRIVARYSGTENKLRLMVEDETEESAKTVAQSLNHELQKAMSHGLVESRTR